MLWYNCVIVQRKSQYQKCFLDFRFGLLSSQPKKLHREVTNNLKSNLSSRHLLSGKGLSDTYFAFLIPVGFVGNILSFLVTIYLL